MPTVAPTPAEAALVPWAIGALVAALVVVFGGWVHANNRILSLVRERRATNERIEALLTRVDLHLQHAALVERIARAAIAETTKPDAPQRRRLDDLVMTELEQETQ